MLKFEWNALRVGHHVIVHDQVGDEFPLVSGTVALLETARGKGSPMGVGVRVAADGGGSRIIWPSHLATHHDPPDPSEDCWRCAALADTAAQQLVATTQPELASAR